MPNSNDIVHALRSRLADIPDEQLKRFVQTLLALAEPGLAQDEARRQLEDAAYRDLLSRLRGQTLLDDGTYLTVTLTGDIVNGDAVRGDKVGGNKYEIHFHPPTPTAPQRPPMMASALPSIFVKRPAEHEQLVVLLTRSEETDPVAITAALRGAGGYGKTTLATALCHDARIHDAFPDGIVWVTLGEHPTPNDIFDKIDDIVSIVTGGQRIGFVALEAARARLAEVLGERRCLFVVDDVWNAEHLQPFLQGGARTTRLITTRDSTTLPFNTQEVTVDAMRQNEASQLLSTGFVDPTNSSPALSALAGRLGEWPLLLTLVNSALRAYVRRGASYEDAITYVTATLDRRGLTAFDARDPVARSQAVKSTIEASLELLSAEERVRYSELAIFPEDVTIPLATLTRYWEATAHFDDVTTHELCLRLDQLSLLQVCNLATRTVRLHDVVRSYLTHEHQHALRSWHHRLLAAHRPNSAVWADLPEDDPYMWDQLVYHLQGAAADDALFELVRDARWWSARRRHDLTSFKLTHDLDTARTSARRSGVSRLATFTLLSFLRAYLGTLIANLPDEVIEILARVGHGEQAYQLASLFDRPRDQVMAWWNLGKWYLKAGDSERALPLLKQARDCIVLLTRNRYRPNHLASFAAQFYRAGQPDEAQQCLEQASILMEPLVEEEWRNAFTSFLEGMYDYPPELLQSSLERAEHVARHKHIHPLHRAVALAFLAERYHHIDSQHAQRLVEEAYLVCTTDLETLNTSSDEYLGNTHVDSAASIIADVALQLGREQEAFSLVRLITRLVLRADVLVRLSGVFIEYNQPAKARNTLVEAAQLAETLQGIEQDSIRCGILKQYLSLHDLVEAQRIVPSIQDVSQRINAICTLITYFSAHDQVVDAEVWLARLNTSEGIAIGQAALGKGLVSSNPDAALIWLRQALDYAEQIREGIVGSRYHTYAYVANCIRDIADTHPREVLELLKKIIQDLQAQPGSNALVQYNITEHRDEALACAAETLAERGAYREGAKLAQAIQSPLYRDLFLLICLRYACHQRDWTYAASLLTTMTIPCWILIGTAVRNIAMIPSQVDTVVQQLHTELLPSSPLSTPSDIFCYAAVEFGFLGYTEIAQSLFALATGLERKHEKRVEFAYLLARQDNVELALQVAEDFPYSSHRAQALATIANVLANQDPIRAEAFVARVWDLLNPYGLPREHWTTYANHADTLIAVAGTVAHWNVQEADAIVAKYLSKPEDQLRGRGAVSAAVEPQEAYDCLAELLDQAVIEGVGDFWLTMKACTEALYHLIPVDQFINLYEQMIAVEQWQHL